MTKIVREPGESIRSYNGRLLAHEDAAGWTQDVPALQRWYWHWSGHEDDTPLPTSVFLGGAELEPFVTCGQLGLTHAIPCAQYGGWWHPMAVPPVPVQ